MRRLIRSMPSVALFVGALTLLYGGWRLRDSAAERADRSARQAFAESVQRGERPRVSATNLAGALRLELQAQDHAATERARLATALEAVAVLGLVSLAAGFLARGRQTDTESLAA